MQWCHQPLVDSASFEVQAMIRAAAAAKQTFSPHAQRAAAKPLPPGPGNRLQLLDDDVHDTQRHAAEGVRASAGGQHSWEAALQRSASVGRAPAAAGAAPPAAALAAAATRPPRYLPARLPPVQTTSATPHNPQQRRAPPQLPLPQPSPEVQTPPPLPAAPRPTSTPAVLPGDGAADNFECPLTMDVMEDPVCGVWVQCCEMLHHLNVCAWDVCCRRLAMRTAVMKYSMRLWLKVSCRHTVVCHEIDVIHSLLRRWSAVMASHMVRCRSIGMSQACHHTCYWTPYLCGVIL